MSDRGDQTVRNPHIVVRDVPGGKAWVCEDCGNRGMSLSGGPGREQLRYAREKHRCYYRKGRECGP
jgi:hypothetical protein